MIVQTFYLLTLILPLVTVLIVFGMKYWSAAMQSRAAKAGEEAYRALAEKAVAAQRDNASALSALHDDLAKLSGSLSAVEKILKQVG
jgi:Tfp pilus assembly protein PilO